MKQNENNNRDATLGGDEDRSNFVTINNLRIRARLARDGSEGEGTPNSGSPFSPTEAAGGFKFHPSKLIGGSHVSRPHFTGHNLLDIVQPRGQSFSVADFACELWREIIPTSEVMTSRFWPTITLDLAR